MVALPEDVFALINEQKAAKVLGTRSANGDVHLINVGGAGALDPETIFIGEIFMKKTGENLKLAQKEKTKASVLVSQGFKSYEIKVSVKDHLTSGPVFDKMAGVFKSMKFDLKGLWLLKPEEVWNESPTYDAGKKMI
ncbi:MAG: pyridoxamine 5'-phosphate oxidase family protein [Methanomassiliicoccus sp.]|nr:pyridoxamine 5'-phosphate oxidase family protein [Methanomassiliicoccus sp.]